MSTTKPRHRFVGGLHLFVISALLAGLALGPSPPPVAEAATITVTTNADEDDGNANPANGAGTSLREAIEYSAAGDTIEFNLTYPATITLGGTELTINKNLTITGPGAGSLTISGNDASRVFYIGSFTVVTISGLTIANGNTAGTGGGILNEGTLTLNNCTVSGNSATSWGGGISTVQDCGCTVTLNNCTVSGNSASRGGGIGTWEYGTVTLNNCTVSDNSATSSGGGIMMADFGNFNFKNSIIAGNTVSSGTGEEDCGKVDYGNTPISQGYNLMGSATGCPNNGTTDVTPASPLSNDLNPTLADNGGPTQTHALPTGSQAIDHIPNGTNGCGTTYTTDQRGVGRPQPPGGNCDIGAYEARQYSLMVNKAGIGSGAVSSDPAGINCGADCTEAYAENTVTILTATPDAANVFIGWRGDCDANGQVAMDADKTCTATFGLPVGGIVVPVNRLGLVVPWMGVVALAGFAGLGAVLARRRRGD